MYQRSAQGFIKHLDFILLDLLCLHISFLLAFMARHGLRNPYADKVYSSVLVFLTLSCVLISIFFHTFKNVLKRGYYKEFIATVRQACLVVLMITFYLFAIKSGQNISRAVICLMGAGYTFFSYGTRLLWKSYLRKKLKEGIKRSLIIVTTSGRAQADVLNIQEYSLDMFRIAGVIVVDEENPAASLEGIPVMAANPETMEAVSGEWVDEALIDIQTGEAYPEEIVNQLMEMGVVVHICLEGIFNPLGQKQFVERIGRYTVLTSSINTASSAQMLVKRLLDITAGVLGCIVTGILLLFIGPAIYLQSPGPVFFAQTRVGKNGRKFKMYKFRSMYLDAEERKAELMEKNRVADGRMFKLDYDPRIIGSRMLPDGKIKKGIGNFIRDWSLDEFPQFLNVLKGDMSLVGTRPPTVDEWEKYDLHHRVRLAVKPGITGLWQVSGRSNITDFEEVVKLDLDYIANWNLGMDIKIILKTIRVVLGKKGAM